MPCHFKRFPSLIGRDHLLILRYLQFFVAVMITLLFVFGNTTAINVILSAKLRPVDPDIYQRFEIGHKKQKYTQVKTDIVLILSSVFPCATYLVFCWLLNFVCFDCFI